MVVLTVTTMFGFAWVWWCFVGMACFILFGSWRVGWRVIWVGDLWIVPVGLVVVRCIVTVCFAHI